MSSASTAAKKIWLPASCAVALFAAGLLFAPAQAHPASGMFERLGRMELLVIGQISPQLPLPQRIAALEAQLFGRPQSGALPERLTRIQEFVESSRQSDQPLRQTTTQSPPVHSMPKANPAVTGLLRQALDEHNKGNDSESEKLYRQVLAKEPFNAHASFNLGALSERRGDLTAALGHYHTALLGDPNDRQLQEAVASVEEQIAQTQKPVFTNPLRTTAGGSTVLQGRASQLTVCGDTDYTGGAAGQALVPQAAPDFRLFQQSPVSAPLIPPRRRLPQATTALTPPPVLPITQPTPPSASKAVFKSAAKAAVITAVRFAPIGGGLHCPLCRLLGGF